MDKKRLTALRMPLFDKLDLIHTPKVKDACTLRDSEQILQDSKFPHFIKWSFLNAPRIKHHRNAVEHIADQKC